MRKIDDEADVIISVEGEDKKKYLVRCLDENGVVIGAVPYTDNLDTWDGSSWNSGSIGKHMGIGKTKDGQYYICYGSNLTIEDVYAKIVNGEEAFLIALLDFPLDDYAKIVSEEEAKKISLEHNWNTYRKFFGSVPKV